MGGLANIAQASLSAAQHRLETVAHNVANTGTAGFKAQIPFQQLLEETAAGAGGVPGALAVPEPSTYFSFDPGKLVQTGNPLDLALASAGVFILRKGEETLYSRQGQFTQDGDGRLVTGDGYVLQRAGGGDLTLSGGELRISPEGVVFEDDQPVGKIGVAGVEDPAALKAMSGTRFAADQTLPDAEAILVRQGMVEAANVDMAAEMTRMMQAVREAETASRIMQTYDTLIGQAITTFGS